VLFYALMESVLPMLRQAEKERKSREGGFFSYRDANQRL
jgi:hypothetical protein